MKRSVWLILGIMILAGIGDVFGQGETLYVKIEKENLRAAPSGKKTAELLSGTSLKVLERQQNWVKVQVTGWIWANSLAADPTEVSGYTIRVSHILVKTRELADRYLSQLKQGAAFDELAKQHSIDQASGAKGGDLGAFGRGDLLAEFEDVAFKLKVGELSGVVQTALGYHIIKRTE